MDGYKEMQARLHRYEEDSVIIREGEERPVMYKIVSGKVAVYLHYGTKDEYLIGILSEGRCFNERGVLHKSPSMYTMVAVYDALILSVSESEFEDFLRHNISNAMDIIKSLTTEIVTLKGNIDMLMEEMSHGTLEEKRRAEKFESQIKTFLKTGLEFIEKTEAVRENKN
ncbi:MAG: cyclic nucleotide-binding domain-containing protein [Eubacterium sp.]|nr:cyclic nucleotide-binding domain-containing protein [Eubacterium sp.]